MQSGEFLKHEEQMTLSPSPASMAASVPITSPSLGGSSSSVPSPSLASSPPVSSPSIASSPPVSPHISSSHLTSISNLRTTSSLLHLDKHAALANKLRRGKVLSNHVSQPPSFNVRTSLIGEEEEDGRSDIRVLSPSLVNSQVLSKTRPVSPDPPDQMAQTTLHNGEKYNYSGRGLDPTRGENNFNNHHPKDNNENDKSKGRGRGRRRPRLFKLKFHHQALPPEYLDHYEASLRQEQRAAAAAAASANSSPATTPTNIRHNREMLVDHEPSKDLKDSTVSGLQGGVPRKSGRGRGRSQRNPRPITIHEAGGGATEALIRDILLTRPHLQQAALQHAALARAQSVPSIMLATQNGRGPPSPGSITPEEHLPYMGEMLIDTKPKRGRKPKKADIAHLINKNYGVPGIGQVGMIHETMHHLDPLQQLQQQLEHHQHQQQQQQQLQQQHRISEERPGMEDYPMMEHESLARSRSYSSLLHTALTAAEAEDQNEPLNLCVRDEPLKYDPEQSKLSSEGSDHPRIKLEPPPQGDEEDMARGSSINSPDNVQWVSNGRISNIPSHWLHDYRLKTEDGLSSGHSTPSLCSQSSHMPSLSPPVFPHMSPPPSLGSPHIQLPAHFMAVSPRSPHTPSPVPAASPLPPGHHHHHHRHVHALLKESLQQRLEEAARERLSPQEHLAKERGSGRGSRSGNGGARKKRSALFIPPADPNTEVSICKFKFTGGPNPMLEEKKKVSVDAGGTMRYFSSGERGITRDSSALGSQLRLSGKLLDNITKCEKDVKKIRLESDTDDTCSLSGLGSATTSPVPTLERGMQPPTLAQTEDSPKRKRRSKKSSVREKLEQTLRERGLLIQTQQVESAEGATYCKFRQLRKFTRYLFRSWKDYLPGQLQEGDIPIDINDPRYSHHHMHGPLTPDHR